MRTFGSVVRSLVFVSIVMAVSVPATAAGFRDREPRDKGNPIIRIIKQFVRSLGDGLTDPKP